MLLHHRLLHRGVPLLVAFSLAFLAFQGCGQAPTRAGYGTLSVQLQFDQGFENTGAAGAGLSTLDGDLIPKDRTPLSDLIITFDRVEAWDCQGDTMDTGDDDSMEIETASALGIASEDDSMEVEDTDCDVHVVADTTITLSVAGLDTTLTQLLALSDLPAGDYSGIALRLTDARVVTQAGDTVQAALPGDSDRLKVDSPFTISEGSVTDVVIVFDVHRSIVENPPGSMNFKIKPVLHSHQGWYEEED